MPSWKLSRVEADQGIGIPDVLLEDGKGRFQFIELKVLSRGNKVKFQPSQVSFLCRHASALCWILIENKKSEPYTYLLYAGWEVLKVVELGIKHPAWLTTADLTKILKYIEAF